MRSFVITTRSLRTISFPTTFQQRAFTAGRRLLVRQTGQSPEEVEQKKDEQVEKQEQGKGEWHESLATSSEAKVKSDQDNVKDHDEHIKKLQKETANAAEKSK